MVGIHHRVIIGFVLCGYCQNLLDDPRIIYVDNVINVTENALYSKAVA